jgi:hypothetical protein
MHKEADSVEYSDDDDDVHRSDDEVKHILRAYLSTLHDLDADDEVYEDDDSDHLEMMYNRAGGTMRYLKKTALGQSLSADRFKLLNMKTLFGNTYAFCKENRPYNYFKADIQASLHTAFQLLLSIAVMTENRALCAGAMSYDLSSRIGLLLPGKRHDGHINTLEDFEFEGERAFVLFPDKKNEEPYYKVHLLDAGLAERAMRILYSSDERLTNNDILKALVSCGLHEHFAITSEHTFKLRYVRNISLTMLPFVWDTTPIHENSLTAISMQAHHKDISTSLIYTNSKVIGTVARKGSLRIDGGNLQVAVYE